MTGPFLLACGAAAGAVGLAVLAAVLLARLAEDRDVSARLRAAVRADPVAEPRAPSSLPLAPLRRLGEAIRDSTLVPEREAADLGRACAAAGLDPRRAVPLLLAAKAVLLLAAPVIGVGLALLSGLGAAGITGSALAGVVAGVFVPNRAMDWLRRPFHEKLRRGLPDALDLLVVAAEAGLGLETALERVAREMERTNRPIFLELTILVGEMRVLPDRRAALERLGERTGLEGFRRLGGTLSQTLRYGTPLAGALRVLATEMRGERMLRIEEKAVRLPALLVMPLILFILPALFIALIGPSVIEMSKSFGAGG